MKIDVITVFPEMFRGFFGRAIVFKLGPEGPWGRVGKRRPYPLPKQLHSICFIYWVFISTKDSSAAKNKSENHISGGNLFLLRRAQSRTIPQMAMSPARHLTSFEGPDRA